MAAILSDDLPGFVAGAVRALLPAEGLALIVPGRAVADEAEAAVRVVNEAADMLADIIRARSHPWRQIAACRGRGNVMFPPSKHGNTASVYSPPLELCATCPVVDPCRAAGARERHGVCGGLAPSRHHQPDE